MWRTTGLCGSVLVHAGLAYCLLQSAGKVALAPEPVGEGEPGGAITLSLATRVPTAAAAAPAPVISRPASDGLRPTAPQKQVELSSAVAAVRAAPRQRDDGMAAPAAASAAAPSGVSQADDLALGLDYQRKLLEHIEPFKRYPEDASRAGVRGVVELSFDIDRRGRLLGVWVAKTSGSASLDAAAVNTLRRSEPLPPIPPSLPDQISVDLPVEFTGAG